MQSLRLLLVTPLLVTRFDETEIAAWYLFASLNFFGTLMVGRFGLSFSRMFSFAMGGAESLEPKSGSAKPSKEDANSPNWHSFARAYGTLGVLMFLIGFLNLLVAVVMGVIGIGNLTQGHTGAGSIWLAFGIFQFTQFVLFNFRRYGFALVGMNYVAMNARWGMIFSILSVIVGSFVLSVGGGIVALVIAMQVIALLNPIRTRFLLSRVEGGRVLQMSAWRWDKEAFSWGWGPTWKGFLSELGFSGVMRVVAIVFTAHGSKSEIATYLFSMRMMETLVNFCQVPYSSIQPRLSRLLAAGDLRRLVVLLKQRYRIVWLLTSVSVLFAAYAFPFGLELVGSNVDFMGTEEWLLLGALVLLVRFLMLNASVVALGNHMPYYPHAIVAFIVGSIAITLLGNTAGLLGPILCNTVPFLVFLNVRTIFDAARLAGESVRSFLVPDFSLIFVIFAISSVVAVYIL